MKTINKIQYCKDIFDGYGLRVDVRSTFPHKSQDYTLTDYSPSDRYYLIVL